jgi:hypothetical protein
MVQAGEDPGFNEKRFQILRASDAFGIRNLDGNRTVKGIVARKINPPEPALA